MEYQIDQSDVIEWANAYRGEPFHALLCDPPYELAFMGKQWDATGISYRVQTWQAYYHILHPGAFGMAFGGSRTVHRIAVAIEDAGFIIHPLIGWIQGQGFPKATRIDTQIDNKIHVVESGISIIEIKRKLIALFNSSQKTRNQIDEECGFRACNYLSLPSELKKPDPWVNLLPSIEKWGVIKKVINCTDDISQELDRLYEKAERQIVGFQTKARKKGTGIPLPIQGETKYWTWDITVPSTDLARDWAGHRYGKQALKPSLEPVVVFQKPYEGKPVDSITSTGAGALNIDGARIGLETIPSNRWTDNAHPFGNGAGNEYETVENVGRWPANVVLSHSPACTPSSCVPGCGVLALGEKSGSSLSPRTYQRSSDGYGWDGRIGEPSGKISLNYGDSGTAARFFFNADWNLENADPFFYAPKVSPSERNAGIKNPHPSLKPILLCQHLATLLLPPDSYAPRRLVVPFCGTGSEMIGAVRAGWDIVQGIERESEYVQLARARLEHWSSKPYQPKLMD